MTLKTTIFSLFLCTYVANAALADPLLLQNDGWSSGDVAGYQSGFVAGEEGAVTLGPVNQGYTIQTVRFLFGGATAETTLTLHIYAETGSATPGSEIFSEEYVINAANDVMHEIDLTAENLTFADGESFRVSIEPHHSGEPAIARDDDGVESDRNWIYAQGIGWIDSPSLGLAGDFIIRALVNTDGPVDPDAGQPSDDAEVDAGGDGDVGGLDEVEMVPDAEDDAGGDTEGDAADAPTEDAAAEAGDGAEDGNDGCGCAVKVDRPPAPPLLALLLGAALLLNRRCRRRRPDRSRARATGS